MSTRTYFIKAGRSVEGAVKLDPVLVAINKYRGVETTIILDANVIISMERVVDNGNKWSSVKEQGLHNLIKLLQKCPPQSACLSPGLALKEMPPELAKQAKEKYELFFAKHLPGFVDTPNSVDSNYRGKKHDYGFKDLDEGARAVLAIPFACILYLNLIENSFSGTPIEKFFAYLDCLETEVDVLSVTEIEIAKYCFANPPADCRVTIELRKKIRRNFLKTGEGKLPSSFSEVMNVAFNGACDIHLLQSANAIDQNGLDGIEQDCWIATQDKKLFDFCSFFHHVSQDGEVGRYAASTIHPEHLKDPYWSEAAAEFELRSIRRRAYHESRDFQFDDLPEMAEKAIMEVEHMFS